MSDTYFVPVAFTYDEALHLLGAARAVVSSAGALGAAGAEMAPLARAMVRLAEASDEARAKHLSESSSGVPVSESEAR